MPRRFTLLHPTASKLAEDRFFWPWVLLAIIQLFLPSTCLGLAMQDRDDQEILGRRASELLGRDNLVAWCIVPFDAQKRTPEQRAQMLVDLGIQRCAYDWRQEHVAEFEREIEAYRKHDITYQAFWDYHPQAMQLFAKHDLHPAIWKMIPDPGEIPNRVDKAVEALLPLARETKEQGCQLSLYNHGGWAGSPETMVAVCQKLRDQGFSNVGIVWNFHHGHDYIANWPAVFNDLLPYLHCLNINGMNDNATPKILPVGQGKHDIPMLEVVLRSPYAGPIGILDHLPEEDSRKALQANLTGVTALLERWSVPVPSRRNQSEEEADLVPVEYSDAYLEQLLGPLESDGNPDRGVQVFAANRFACLSCHQVDQYGGKVGPELTEIGRQRKPDQLAASILWPNHEVEEKYRQLQVLTTDGKIHRGLILSRDDQALQIQDPNLPEPTTIQLEDIDEESLLGSVMPEGIAQAMTLQQQRDLVAFLSALGRGGEQYQEELKLAFAHSHPHQSRPFPYQAAPRHPELWPNHNHPVNRQRIYNFYGKQAEHYRNRRSVPLLLEAYPSLDGPDTGHWGNQNEDSWRDGRWNQVQLGQIQAGVTRLTDVVIPRGVNVQLPGGVFYCYDIDRLCVRAYWRDGFLTFSDVRHGFMDALKPLGKPELLPVQEIRDAEYLGLYQDGHRVAFAYQIGEQIHLDAPHWKDGKLQSLRLPLEQHPWKDLLLGPTKLRWPETIKTAIHLGQTTGPYQVDTIVLPQETADHSLLFFSGLDFLPDGAGIVATMQGEIWRVTGLSPTELDSKSWQDLAWPEQAEWKKIAEGLHQPLGVKVHQGRIYVQCRDQLLELIDRNEDQEIDYYRCVNKAFITSPAGHDYICGLQCDSEGNFYTVSGNQGLLRLSPDGQSATVLATGFRNPDGLGILPDGTLTIPCSEGDWTPASMVCAVGPDREGTPHYGYRGPVNNQAPELPWFYLPRGMDNSSAEQVWCGSTRWGPLKGHAVHLSFGSGTHFYVLPDSQHPQQAAVIPLPGDFDSGIHRGRFHPVDGQLYVAGMSGWGTYTPEDGCFQRVRYTGQKFLTPTGISVHENGVLLQFNQPLPSSVAESSIQHFAQCWNYRYSQGYGSPELSPSHPGMVGHDSLTILSSHIVDQGTSLFLEIPDLQPVNQLHLNVALGQASLQPENGLDLFVTVHELAPAFDDYPGYRQRAKTVAVHPIMVDMSLLNQKHENRFRQAIKGARPIEIATGQNLTYQTTRWTAAPGEAIALTLTNTDVVPHNWVLVRPGQLSNVGKMANHLIADPLAALRQYVPETDQVLAATDIVDAGGRMTIYFRAPEEPGEYPYLCTFPGHWMVMNGVLTVQATE